MFSKAFFFRVVKSLECVVKSLNIKYVLCRIENIVGKGGNATFILFPQSKASFFRVFKSQLQINQTFNWSKFTGLRDDQFNMTEILGFSAGLDTTIFSLGFLRPFFLCTRIGGCRCGGIFFLACPFVSQQYDRAFIFTYIYVTANL